MEIFTAILAGWKMLTPEQRKAIGRATVKFANIIKTRLIDAKEYSAEEIAELERQSDLDPSLVGLT